MSPSLAKSALLLCASLLGSASAAPAVGKQQPAPGSANQAFLINYNVCFPLHRHADIHLTRHPQFETVSSTLGQLPLSDHPINDYALLHFKTLLINQTQPSLGVPCHTAPACSVFTLSSDLLEGLLTPGQNPVSIDGPAYITAAYQYSPITFFDPYAWYFGKHFLAKFSATRLNDHFCRLCYRRCQWRRRVGHVLRDHCNWREQRWQDCLLPSLHV